MESWSGVEWSLEWSGVEFGVEWSSHFGVYYFVLDLWQINIIAIDIGHKQYDSFIACASRTDTYICTIICPV